MIHVSKTDLKNKIANERRKSHTKEQKANKYRNYY